MSMRSFFSIRRKYSPEAMKVKVDYTLNDVQDPLQISSEEPTPSGFLNRFKYTVVMGQAEDALANNIGWFILSPSMSDIFRRVCSTSEIELIPLRFERKDGPIAPQGYHVLGVKRHISCLDMDCSEVTWGTVGGATRYIMAVHRCVIADSKVPGDVNCFMIREYAVFPVISMALADLLVSQKPTGIYLEQIETC